MLGGDVITNKTSQRRRTVTIVTDKR